MLLLTGQFYAINQDPALKAVQAKFPNVDIKAIQDDITYIGDPDDLFDEVDDEGRVTKIGALSVLIHVQELEACGLKCNLTKFACVETTPNACEPVLGPMWWAVRDRIRTESPTDVQGDQTLAALTMSPNARAQKFQ
jgi:hypothetical protein